MIPTSIILPQKGVWPDVTDTVARAVHLYAHYSIVGLPADDPNIYFGREYLLAVSRCGTIWTCYGDSKAVRSMAVKAKRAFFVDGRSYDKMLASLLKKRYRVVGEINSSGRWSSDHFSYPATGVERIETAADVPLSVRYPLGHITREAFKDTKGSEWF